MSDKPTFRSLDLLELDRRGIPVEEAERQLELLRTPPPGPQLARPCTIEDGVWTCVENDHERLVERAAEAARKGRLVKFVPASGVASRMFRDLAALDFDSEASSLETLRREAADGSGEARSVLEVLERISDFAFYDEISELARGEGRDLGDLIQQGDLRAVVNYILSPRALNYANLPKGLLSFHERNGKSVTPFEEHLVEAAATIRGSDGVCRLHFTVSPDHLDKFESHLESLRTELEQRLDVRFEVTWSVQKPSTDTLASDSEGQPHRNANEELVFRPGGHGALIENLNDLEGDIVLIKNIDNVVPEWLAPDVHRWKLVLAGLLLEIQDEVFGHRKALEENPDSSAIDAAKEFVKTTLSLSGGDEFDGATPERQIELLRDRLDRPLRVCGVVRNEGEPGGGPFWVRENDGTLSRQIVETAQVSEDAPEQQAVLGSATHFNPVDIVCGLRNWKSEPFHLQDFVDNNAVFVAQKSQDGQDLNALERPGLWNGGMAFWNTIFVEVPVQTFNPVKTVNDLLRPAHQPKNEAVEKQR